MAKPITELLNELPKAFEKADQDRTAANAAVAVYHGKVDAAKAAYDAVVTGAAADLKTATDIANESEAYLGQIQGEVAKQLGIFQQSRVTISK